MTATLTPAQEAAEETLFYTHPSVEKRALRPMEWKAAHPEAEALAATAP